MNLGHYDKNLNGTWEQYAEDECVPYIVAEIQSGNMRQAGGMWNARERTGVHEEVMRKRGFEEQGIHMRMSLYVINIEGLIYECSE